MRVFRHFIKADISKLPADSDVSAGHPFENISDVMHTKTRFGWASVMIVRLDSGMEKESAEGVI